MESEHLIPSPKVENVPVRWRAAGQAVKVHGITILGGMIYVGTPEFFTEADPAFIDPSLPVTPQYVSPACRVPDYWPSYAKLPLPSRRAYLQWLAGGRKDPQADIGYVFLFFYGLEYRCLQETPTASDLRAIVDEVRRLAYLYGSNVSFARYAHQFLNVLTAKVVAVPAPTPPNSLSLLLSWRALVPRMLKEDLVGHVLNQTPVPAHSALNWAFYDREIGQLPKFCRTVLFRRLFAHHYERAFGAGFIPTWALERVSISYSPASAGFQGKDFTWDLGERPGAYEVRMPQKEIAAVFARTADELRPYYKYTGVPPLEQQPDSLEALGLLPVPAWPASLKERWALLLSHFPEEPKPFSIGNLAKFMGLRPLLTPATLHAYRALCAEQVLELDPFAPAGKVIDSEAKLVVYRRPGGEGPLARSARIETAELVASLAYWVACELGGLSPVRQARLYTDLGAWEGLNQTERFWLVSYAKLMVLNPPLPLVKLKTRLKAFPEWDSTAVRYLARLAHADGAPSPAEVKVLTKAYKAFGRTAADLYTDLNDPQGTGRRSGAPSGDAPGAPLVLDVARIALLQEETAAVAKMLGDVFVEEPTTGSAPASVQQPAPLQGTWGLDVVHSGFLRELVAQATWARADLVGLASRHSLMLDGALEVLNEAALDNFDMPLTEGDDPVEVNEDVRREL